MKSFLKSSTFLLIGFLLFFLAVPAFAQSPDPSEIPSVSSDTAKQQPALMNTTKPIEVPMTAKVIKVLENTTKEQFGEKRPFQRVQLQILDGAEKDKMMTIGYGDQTTLRNEQRVHEGQTVVLMKTTTGQTVTYQIIDIYRLNNLVPFVVLFLAVVLLVSRLKGFGALVGLIISFIIIIKFMVPNIISGEDPLMTSIVGSFFIMVITMYVAHGFSKKTHIALFATTFALVLSGALAYISVNYTFLTGLGSEDAATLLYGPTGNINFQGLLLGGIIIGSLGVLNDITIGLAASMHELALANPKFTFREFFSSGLRIGSEHIAALVNTLALAYAGAGLPVFMFIVLNPSHQPWWLILNSELLAEEIVRTLAGSIGLILAVPLTAVFGALAFAQKR